MILHYNGGTASVYPISTSIFVLCDRFGSMSPPLFFLLIPPPPSSTLFPYTTLFRSSRISLRGRSAASLRQNCVTVFSFSKNHFSSPSGRWSIVLLISSWGSTL